MGCPRSSEAFGFIIFCSTATLPRCQAITKRIESAWQAERTKVTNNGLIIAVSCEAVLQNSFRVLCGLGYL